MRVLGVDPGLSTCGLAVVEGAAQTAAVVRAGVVRTAADEPTAERLKVIHDQVSSLLATLRPLAVAVERVFVNANRSTAMGVGQAAGVVLLAAAQAGVPAVEYTPSQVKAAVTGNGDADKEQVAFMVRALLDLAEEPRPPDLADALALGLCHLRQGGLPTPRGGGAVGGGMSPRLAAAVAAAGPGAQVTRRREGGG